VAANGNGHSDGKVTVAVAAVVLRGKRPARLAQWLKIYDREEDRFFCVRPDFLVVQKGDLAAQLHAQVDEFVAGMEAGGLAYIGSLSYESEGDKTAPRKPGEEST